MSLASAPSSSSNRSYKKLTIYVLFLVALGALAWGGYVWWKSAHTPPNYVFAEVTQGDIERSVNVTGSINPRVTVQVGSYVSGTVKSLSCDFNTEVKAGQVCAKIDPSTFQVAVDQNEAQLNSTRAQLRKDQASLSYAKSVLDRDTKLLADGIVAQEILDNDKNLYKQGLAQIEADKAAIAAQEASLKSAQVNLGYTTIVSPVDGTVLTRNVDVGQTVASSLQTPTLFLIAKDMTKMQVDANVSEADVGRIQVGQDVTFSVQAFPDKEFTGKVRQIRKGPITVQNVVTYDVAVAVDNPDLLLFPGMTADAEIITDSRENVMRIPLAATRFTPEHAGHGRERDHAADSERHADKTDAAPAPVASASSVASSSAIASIAAVAKATSASEKTSANSDHPWGNHGERGQHGNWSRDGAGEHRWQHREQAQDDSSADGEHRGHRAGNHGGGNRRDTPQTAPVSIDSIGAGTEHIPAPKKTPQARKRNRIWVMRDGAPKAIWVTTGLDDGDMIEVLSGDLKVGDKIIVSEVRTVEAKAPAVQSPFAPQGGGGGRRGMGR